jgi:phosphoribosylglycinamide formyltransferase-1
VKGSQRRQARRSRASPGESRAGQGRAIGVLVSGEGTNLQALIDQGLPVLAVASSRPGVRALERARAAGIETAAFPLVDHATREARDAAMADWLEQHGVSLVVCAGFMELLTTSFLARVPDRIVNVHPSLLPQFPGTRPIDEAVAAGVDATGVTVHLVDEGVDTGRVLAQEEVAVEPRETLVQRIHAVEHRLLPRVVSELCNER